MANIERQGANTIRAHLAHLEGHGEKELLRQALAYLKENNVPALQEFLQGAPAPMHCPGTQAVSLLGKRKDPGTEPLPGAEAPAGSSGLGNWPIQLHLLSPMAPQFRGKDVLLSADCVAYAMGGFHASFLKGKSLAIACPKLDEGKEIYREKLTALIDHAQINTLTVVMMEVPCCRGLLAIAQQAVEKAGRKIPLKAAIVSISDGAVLSEKWV
jgi:hypothetical protein